MRVINIEKITMKKIISLVLVLVIASSMSTGFAQTKSNFGHIDFATLYSMMPGLDSVKIIF